MSLSWAATLRPMLQLVLISSFILLFAFLHDSRFCFSTSIILDCHYIKSDGLECRSSVELTLRYIVTHLRSCSYARTIEQWNSGTMEQ